MTKLLGVLCSPAMSEEDGSSFLDLVRRRRSTRAYRPEPVPREVIDRCLEAARLAPSACNSQPWSFVVVDDPDRVRDLARAACSGVYRMNRWAETAAVLVAVVTERSKYFAALGGQVRNVRYNLIDIGIAGEHLALQAESEGVGTCWIGWFDERALKRLLNIPRGKRVHVILTMGYPASDTVREKKRVPLDELRRYAEPGRKDDE